MARRCVAERSADADYIECSVAGGERKIVGAVDGTLVVVGNSDNAVRSCLEVRRGTRPSIHTDPELLKVRASLASEKTLGFGYISPANSAKLFSWAAPLLMGQAPGDQQLEQLLAVSAGKVLRGVAWTANSSAQAESKIVFSSRSSRELFRVCNQLLKRQNEMRTSGNSCPKDFSR